VTGLSDRQVDHSAIRVNQGTIIALLVLAFVVNAPPLVAFVSIVMLAGTASPRLALFQGIYRRVLKPAGIIKPAVIEDNPEPHRFAQGFGGVVLAVAATLLFTGAATAGWVLAWIVVGLAALNLFLGFCAGCFVYYQLNRLGLPGFDYSPHRRG
jgi:O-antigen/teichoic acid export membrane protein